MKKVITIILFIGFATTNMFAKDFAELYIFRDGKNGIFGMGDMMAYDVVVNDVKLVELGTASYIYVKIPVNRVTNIKIMDPGAIEPYAATGIKAIAGATYVAQLSLNALFVPQLELFEDNRVFAKTKKLNKFSILGEFDLVEAPSQSQIEFASNTRTTEFLATTDETPQKDIIVSDVDQNIPQSSSKQDNTYALIIANEDYQFVDDVNFAAHDGEVFKEYCIKTLGIPERQIRYCANASYGIISGGVDWLKYALNNFEGCKAIVYYCGHGIPDEKTGDAYIIPVDGKGTNTTTCYSLNTLYSTLADTKALNITYFMDACFTGANKEGSMLVAARGVAREAKKEVLEGKAVVFSASSGDETAMTYPEKGHGLFTYFLLKKFQETQGNVSYSDLANYISKNVKKEAFLINEKPQTPIVATSVDASQSWKTMTFK